jgi:hypothetical protein
MSAAEENASLPGKNVKDKFNCYELRRNWYIVLEKSGFVRILTAGESVV